MHALSTPPSSDDAALLEAFVRTGTENAFEHLVRKYLGMVLGIALRRTGDHGMAEEIAQNVFAILARKAAALQPNPTLAGWLHRTAMFECAEALRRRQMHARKMNALSEHALASAGGEGVWSKALPLLDEAIEMLPAADRDLILLRFFEGKNFREIGAALGKSEAAAQKQSERALEKLSRALTRKGVPVPVALLASALPGQFAPSAPAALVQSICHGAVTGAVNLSAKSLLLKTLMTYSQTKAVAALAAVAIVPIGLLWQQNHRLRTELAKTKVSHSVVQPHAAKKPSMSGENLPIVSVAVPAASTPPSTPLPTAATLDAAAVARAWESALFEPDPIRRSERIADLFGSLSAESASSVAEVFGRTRDAGMRFDEEFRLFLRAWGKLDGAAATQHAIDRSGQIVATGETLAALAGWASNDPQSARTWIEGLPKETPEELITGLIDGWSMVDFQAAAAYAESRPASRARDHFRKVLLQRSLAAGGIPAAQQWFHGIADDEQNRAYKQRALDGIVQAMVYRDPSGAAQWVSQFDGQPWLGGEAVRTTAAKLAETSPTAALSWLATLQHVEAPRLASGYASALDSWATHDAQAAGVWLSQQRQHPHYDAMAEHYARAVATSGFDAAVAWSRTIGDEATRARSLAAVAARLFQSEGETAISRLRSAGFTEPMIEAAQAREDRFVSMTADFSLETLHVRTTPTATAEYMILDTTPRSKIERRDGSVTQLGLSVMGDTFIKTAPSAGR